MAETVRDGAGNSRQVGGFRVVRCVAAGHIVEVTVDIGPSSATRYVGELVALIEDGCPEPEPTEYTEKEVEHAIAEDRRHLVARLRARAEADHESGHAGVSVLWVVANLIESGEL